MIRENRYARQGLTSRWAFYGITNRRLVQTLKLGYIEGTPEVLDWAQVWFFADRDPAGS